MEKEKQIEFVSKHYRREAFNADTGWKKLGIAPVLWWKRRLRTVAAVAAVVVVSATAAILYQINMADKTTQQPSPGIETVNVMAEVRVIDFENTPLPEVVAKIESVYNVNVHNLPDFPEQYKLSLHYEGTPGDLINVINEILGTEMSVTER